MLRSWWQVRKLEPTGKPAVSGCKDLLRDPTPNRVRRFGQALVLAAELPAERQAPARAFPAYAGFGDALRRRAPRPAVDAARRMPRTSGPRPNGRSARSSRPAQWLVTCTRANRDHLAALAPPGRVELVYHGIDLARFSPRASTQPAIRDGRICRRPGGDSLGRRGWWRRRAPRCCSRRSRASRRRLHWRFVHVGGGPLQASACAAPRCCSGHRRPSRMARRVDAGSAARRIPRRGPVRAREPHRARRRPRRAAERAAEAQSQALACVATRVSAIPELVRDGQTGLLVEENDPDALARALEALIANPARRRALGQAGQSRVVEALRARREPRAARAQVRARRVRCESRSTHRLSRRRTQRLRAIGASPGC